MILFKIAWRNVWRNRLRSLVVMISIILGIWAGLFIMAMTLGLNEQRMNGAINTYLSHLVIHHPKFLDDLNKKYTIIDLTSLEKQLDTIPDIKSYSERLVVNGLASSSKGNYGIQILGINPKQEKKLTTISQKLVSGSYFTKFKRNPIVIGEKLAHKLGLKVNSKIVLNFQDTDNNTIGVSFRIEGIFKTSSSIFDEGTVFVRKKDLAKLTGLEGKVLEMAIICNKLEETELVKKQIITANKVETWSQISPELGYAQETMSSFIYFFMGIILMALAFGIINTMLMAVLERKHEIGMLMSVGMNKSKIFGMIVLETLFLSLIATPIGFLLSFLSIRYYGIHGIDLSAVAKGLESLGVGARVYTSLSTSLYIIIIAMTVVVALVSSIFPARRALKLKPAEAVKAN